MLELLGQLRAKRCSLQEFCSECRVRFGASLLLQTVTGVQKALRKRRAHERWHRLWAVCRVVRPLLDAHSRAVERVYAP
eukprot:4181662-Prymnesium_polylepis.1